MKTTPNELFKSLFSHFLPKKRINQLAWPAIRSPEEKPIKSSLMLINFQQLKMPSTSLWPTSRSVKSLLSSSSAVVMIWIENELKRTATRTDIIDLHYIFLAEKSNTKLHFASIYNCEKKGTIRQTGEEERSRQSVDVCAKRGVSFPAFGEKTSRRKRIMLIK